MGLIRTILAFVILVILSHIGIFYAGLEAGTNSLTEVIYTLGTLLESPAQALLNVLPVPVGQQNILDPNNFYSVAFTAVVGYFILYLLLGVGRRS
ncbi:MAG: hypothetical protein ACFB50_05160 [Rubrobacteraceae bacterium]